jgi:beta-phosphoglucomutase
MATPALVLARGLGFIFDLDGVIIDSMPVHEKAWYEYLRRSGISVEGLLNQMHGRKNEEILRDFLGSEITDREIVTHGAGKEQLFREMIQGHLSNHLVPGVRKFLSRAEGVVPMAVASNAERANVDFMLEGTSLRGHFTVALDSSRVERPKPSPDIYLLAARELGIAPENCIVFEDSIVGITAARSARMRVVGILTEGIPLKDVNIAVADFTAPELEPWLAEQEIR